MKILLYLPLHALTFGLLSLLAGCATKLPELASVSHLVEREQPSSLLANISPPQPSLRLNHLQLKGSHNSYHRAPRIALSRQWRYSHAPLDVQLETQGVRQLELDVRYARGELFVTHLPIVDGRSTCKRLVDCLARVKRWSRGNPAHLPVFVMIEVKDDLAPARLHGRLDAIDFAITRVFSRDELLTPEDVVGTSPSLRSAVMERGWPTVDESRGRIAFVMMGPRRYKHAYTENRPRLEGRVMFVGEGSPDYPYSSVLFYDDPIAQHALITAAAKQNFLVRTRADARQQLSVRRRDAALASGANFISTDFPDRRYGWVELGGPSAGRCNPLSASLHCDARALLEQSEAVGVASR